MIISIYNTVGEMGREAAKAIARELNQAIERRGEARLLLSTGASQFEMIDELIKADVKWEMVTMFHLDEYVGLPETHNASFRKYLKERLVAKVHLKEAVFVDGEGDAEANIRYLTERITEEPVDVAAIGIGENGHIAFNDPPADFETAESYFVVALDERCKLQQVREGWFGDIGEVPARAISMTISQILKAKVIVSVVPHRVKAEAVAATLRENVNNQVPATILKTHPDWRLFLDKESAARVISMDGSRPD
ncbi:MAG: glucosamine-6-phosphate deaminase [Lachnospiraceae bacterium]